MITGGSESYNLYSNVNIIFKTLNQSLSYRVHQLYIVHEFLVR